MSPQRKYQVKNEGLGVCIKCGKHRAEGDVRYCPRHRELKRSYDMQRWRRLHPTIAPKETPTDAR